MQDLGDHEVAGAMGNDIQAESGLWSSAVEGLEVELIWIVQWSYGRRTSLEAFLQLQEVF